MSTRLLKHALKHSASTGLLDNAMAVHSNIIKCGSDRSIFAMNCLIEMYAKVGSLRSARRVFDDMPQRNLVSWNLMISGYGSNGESEGALELFGCMKHEGTAPDGASLKIVLPILGRAKAPMLGESVHAHLVTQGSSRDTTLATAVLDMYAKCGRLRASEQLFDEILDRDVVCWNAMIAGYSQSARPEMVPQLFGRMTSSGCRPSIPTMLLLIQACTVTSSVKMGKTVHGYTLKSGFSSDASVNGLLTDMYSKCGELISAYWVISEAPEVNVQGWSCMIHGLGMHGFGREALIAFFQMVKTGIVPDQICFLLVLDACSHCGLVKEGQQMFHYMQSQFGVRPRMQHHASIVDLLGRAGCINEALHFISKMPTEPDDSIVGALLGACRIHGHSHVGDVLDWLIGLPWRVAGFYKILVDIYARQNSWDEVIKVRRLIDEKGLKGTSGFSLIESR